MVTVVAGWALMGLIGYFIGKTKSRTTAGLIWGLLLGPIGWLIIAIGPDLGPKCPKCKGNIVVGAEKCKHCGKKLFNINEITSVNIEKNSTLLDTKKCSFCAEQIKIEAKICRYCQKEQPEIDYVRDRKIDDAKRYLNSLKDGDLERFEAFLKMDMSSRRSSCFACKGDTTNPCGMCNHRENSLLKYIEAKTIIQQAI